MCPFCTLNPAIHCTLSQLTPSWLYMKADIVSCTRMCLYPCKSQCAQIDGGRSSPWLPKPKFGAFLWENSTCWATSLRTSSFHLIFLCNHICLLQQLHTTPKYAIWWSGWSAVKILWWKVGSTPRKIRHVRSKLLCSSLGANKNSEHACLWVLSLNIAT